MSSAFWAITSYFNPAGYRLKRPNYREFRRRLSIPLLTVEFAPDGDFELGADEADVMLRVRDGDVLWQKERLLNLAIGRLPVSCEYVAWLDCDVVFERGDWVEAAAGALREGGLCQPFRNIHYLAEGVSGDAIGPDRALMSMVSTGYAWASGTPISMTSSTTGIPNPHRKGHAWCARRELLAAHGLYDRNVIGGGDNMILFGALGLPDGFLATRDLSPAHARDYREWAADFHKDARRISYIEGDLFHLWHGEITKRRYYARGEVLTKAEYDPRRDIAMSGDGCWRWNSDKPEMHRAVKDYFYQREEDGCLSAV